MDCRRMWVGFVALLLTGCGGAADLGFRGTIPAEYRYNVDAALAPGKSVRFPESQPFNVHDKLSAQTPGPRGEAQGAASADETGRATCRATAANGGTAWGRFQLGHCLDNRTGRILLADVEIDVEYDVETRCAAQPTTGTADSPVTPHVEAKVTLRAVVKDSNEVVLRSVDLAVLHNDDGRLDQPGHETPRFTIELQPDLAYTVTVVAHVQVTTDAGTSAEAKVTIKRLAITLTGRS